MTADALRARLVDRLRHSGALRDTAVERALLQVPRHIFAPHADLETAYEDRVIRLKEADGVLVSSLSQPAMIVAMLQQLCVRPGERVLEIGTGSGYTAALLGALAGAEGTVITVDLEGDLVDGAQQRFAQLGIQNVTAYCADGALGLHKGASFDRILLTACASDIEPAWREQLSPAGRMVLPLSLNGVQKSVAFDQRSGALQSATILDCGFVMLRGSHQGERTQRIADRPDIFVTAQTPVRASQIAALLLESEPQWLPVHRFITPQEFDRGGALWIALHEFGFCRLDVAGAEAPHLPTLLEGSGAGRATIGLCCADSIALLALHRAGGPTPGLFVAQYGHTPLGPRLLQLLEEWDSAGAPGKFGIEITGVPHSADTKKPPEGAVPFARPHTTFYVRFC
ncbi:MAG: hypothetical protein NVS1B14_04290 [Vulcanimicrobiaceae bacterium]